MVRARVGDGDGRRTGGAVDRHGSGYTRRAEPHAASLLARARPAAAGDARLVKSPPTVADRFFVGGVNCEAAGEGAMAVCARPRPM